ncbi:MAG: hypothetical protein LBS84_07080 [Clostridiales bacterium]|jgi:hypothetical protein|nr:hypothetical protein [Clostridiales bacterium]
MYKPIDQINAEFQEEFAKPKTSVNNPRINPISFMDTSPNGLTLPLRHRIDSTEAERSKTEQAPRRSGGRNHRKHRGGNTKGKRDKKRRKIKKRASAWRRAVGILIFLSVSIYLLSAIIYINLRYDPLLLGVYYILPRMSDIMETEIPQGSLLIVQSVEHSALKIGDTIIIRQNQELFTAAEIVSFSEDIYGGVESGVFTRGLPEEAAESNFVGLSLIKGRVVSYVPVIGGIMSLISNNLLFVGIAYICLILFINAIRKLISSD